MCIAQMREGGGAGGIYRRWLGEETSSEDHSSRQMALSAAEFMHWRKSEESVGACKTRSIFSQTARGRSGR